MAFGKQTLVWLPVEQSAAINDPRVVATVKAFAAFTKLVPGYVAAINEAYPSVDRFAYRPDKPLAIACSDGSKAEHVAPRRTTKATKVAAAPVETSDDAFVRRLLSLTPAQRRAVKQYL